MRYLILKIVPFVYHPRSEFLYIIKFYFRILFSGIISKHNVIRQIQRNSLRGKNQDYRTIKFNLLPE